MTEKDGKEVPYLFDTYNEAFVDMFDDAAETLRVSDEPINHNILIAMDTLLVNEDVEGMKAFWAAHQDECNPREEWVESTRTFLRERRAIYTSKGLVIQGRPISTI
jgi:hypothetical protein